MHGHTRTYLELRILPKQIPSLYSGRSHSTLAVSQIREHYSDKWTHRNRMWSSAMHFAIGFFGYPFEGQYKQSITIEHDGVSFFCPFLLSLLMCPR